MKQGQTERLKAQRKGNYLMLTGSLRGKTVRCFIDSGANAHAFGFEAAGRLGMVGPDAVDVRGGGAGAEVTMKLFSLSGLTLGRLALAESRAVAVPFPEELELIDGVLGYPLFAQYVVTLDYADEIVTLTPPETFQPPKAAIALPLQLNNGMAQIEVKLDGRKLRVDLDTGDGGILTLNAPYVAKNKVIDAYPKAVTVPTGKSVGGLTYGRLARARELQMGPFRMSQPVVALSESKAGAEANEKSDGRMGAEIFSRFTVHFDYTRKKLYLEPNARLRDPFIFNRAGVLIQREGKKWVVLAVMPGSEAEKAEIKAGDQLLAVNGKEARQLGDFLIRDLFRGDVGRPIELTLGSVEKPRTIKLILRDLL